MIDKKISLGTLLTIGTVLASVVYTHGASGEKVENVKVEQVKHAKRIDTECTTNRDYRCPLSSVLRTIVSHLRHSPSFLFYPYHRTRCPTPSITVSSRHVRLLNGTTTRTKRRLRERSCTRSWLGTFKKPNRNEPRERPF